MKSKITVVVFLVIIIFLGALSFFFGYKYFKGKDEVQALNSQIQILKKEQTIIEQNNKTNENEEVKTLAIPKFDSGKVDNSKREDMTNVQECASLINFSGNDIVYRKRPAKKIQPGNMAYDINYQLKFKDEQYNFGEANIVDVRSQRHGSASDWYIIVLLDDGTIKYALNTSETYENGKVEFKEYDLKNVVALVYLGSTNGKSTVGVGAITNDGVTHILPYDMP